MSNVKYRQFVGGKFHYWGFLQDDFTEKLCFVGPITNQMNNPIHCQFTGLTDKNGVEIYEGDIVKMFYQDWLDKTETIKFQDGTFGYGGDFHFSAFNCLARDMRDAKYHFSHAFEVIGNIYQNTELLK